MFNNFLMVEAFCFSLWSETALLLLLCIAVSERNCTPAHSLPSGNSPPEAAVYEDDFVSSHSSQGSGQLKRSSNFHR